MRRRADIAGDHQDNADEWRALIDRLSRGQEPAPPADEMAPSLDDPTVRKRIGIVITRAVLGDPLYQLYQVYCGDPWPL
jgi:hypothetical protein